MNRIVILADESAEWIIAGLTQLDRLALALNEIAESQKHDSNFDVAVFWKPEISIEQRWLPQDPRLSRCAFRFADELSRLGHVGSGRILSTHLLVKRSALANFLSVAPLVEGETLIADTADCWNELAGVFTGACCEAQRISGWRYVAERAEIGQTERWFLRDSGKTQDGFVSRFLNRPVSRSISRCLSRTSITPSAWTLSILVLPIAAFVYLVRGSYLGFVSGAALFQIYSILDGCDGEIARAKYLESESGRRFDTLCDVLGSLLFALGLGLGLYHLGRLYFWEGACCALMIATNEWFLRGQTIETDVMSGALSTTLYARHRAMIERSGLLFLGEKSVWWLFQLTKRDVAILLFLFLAIAGLPQWILHLWTTATAVSLLLAFTARLRLVV